ncbi:response regulator transcription factor [Achromobacter spanius]|uniref:response regulator transcription factor n=1 Tax=Achromobacter spanius TaxID=217203 RepID=UPI003F68E2B8
MPGQSNAPDRACPATEAMVWVVDDDTSVREALSNLLRSEGMAARTFGSAEEMLAGGLPTVPTCIILDVQLRGLSGLDLQARLAPGDAPFSIVFISGHADVRMTATAMKAGAQDFLAKPFTEEELLGAVHAALDKARARHQFARNAQALRERYATLSPREQQVMRLAAAGLLNKQIAATADISEATVKIHRANAMRKMQARTFAELVLLAQSMGLIEQGG